MPLVWHHTTLWAWCLPKDETKEIEPFFIDEIYYKFALFLIGEFFIKYKEFLDLQ